MSMSQGHPSFPPRATFSSKIPDRASSSLHSQPQQPFGQSAPAFARRGEAQPPNYGGYNNVPAQQPQPQPTYTATGPAGFRPYPEKDTNVLQELSDEQKAEVNEAFSLFDVDKDRHLDYHELRVALRALGFTIQKQEALQIIHANGTPKPSAQRINAGPARGQAQYHASQLLISQNAFARVAAQKIQERDPRDEVERAFYLFDVDRKDFISLDDLRRVTRELGENSLEEQELQNMIEEFDYDGVGGVSKEAFFGICLQ